jgi:gas vesicle protein
MDAPSAFDIAAVGAIFERLVQVGGVLVGMAIGAWTALKLAGKLGVEKRKYEELREDVDSIQKAGYITRPQHDDMQAICQSQTRRMVETQVHDSVREIKDQLSDLNGTLCYFMGQMNIQPPENHKRRRRNDPPDVL